MINEQISGYVASERARGVTDDAIRAALLVQGWKEDDVASAMAVSIAIPSSATGTGEGMFKGRLGKKKYLHIVLAGILGFLLFVAVGLLLGFGFMDSVDSMNAGAGVLAFMLLLGFSSLVYGIMQLGATVRRLHDIGHSGWWALLSFINLVNLVMLLYLCMKDGDDHSNAFGTQADADVTFWQALKGSK